MKRKLLALLLTLACIFGAAGLAACGVSSGSTWRPSPTEEIWNYTLSEDGSYYIVSNYIPGTVRKTEIVIPDTYNNLPVKAIAKKAFYHYESLTSIVIPDSITIIEEGAFEGCSNLIEQENGVSYVDTWAIDCDYDVHSLTLREGTKGIANFAFGGYTALTSITIPDSLIAVGKYAFSNCHALTAVNYTGTVDTWAMIEFIQIEDNPLWYAGHLYINGVEMTEITLTTATHIGSYAFANCTTLTSVTIGDSVTTIGKSAFWECDSLKNVTMGDGITTIGESAFLECHSLKNVTLGDGVTTIGESAFAYCYALTSIIIPDNVTSIETGAFYYCPKLIEVVNKSSLTITAGDSSNGSVAAYAKQVITNEADSKLIEQDDYIFYNDNGSYYLMGYTGNQRKLSLPESINGNEYALYSYAFAYCYNLTKIIIPDSVTDIGWFAFYDCYNLTSATIGDNINIEGFPFYNCPKLVEFVSRTSQTIWVGQDWNSNMDTYTAIQSITSEADSKLIEQDDYIFYNDNGSYYLMGYTGNQTELSLPESINGNEYALYPYAFYACGLTSITIPDGITSLKEGAFEGCSNLIEKENGVYYVDTWAIDCDYDLYSLTLRDGTKGIAENALNTISTFLSITIPDSVNYIGDAFSDYHIQKATIPTSAISSIPKSSLTEVIITGGETIEAGAFSSCYNLTSITIPDSVTSIEAGAFSGCDSLTSITIPDSVTSIGGYVFANCSALTDIIIPDSVTSIGERAFYHCDDLYSVTIGAGVTTIGKDAFYVPHAGASLPINYTLTEVHHTGSVDTWAMIEFANKEANPLYHAGHLYINSVEVTEATFTTATKISAYAFYNCTALKSVTIGDSVTSIGEDAFAGCSKPIQTENGVSYIDTWAIACNDKATNVTLKEGTKGIGDYAFNYCDLTSITIPDSVIAIGKSTFWACSDLTEVYYTGTVDTWAMIEFANEEANPLYYAEHLYINGVEITEVALTTATKIGSFAFSGYDALTSVTIPDGVRTIGAGAFSSCSALTSITVDENNANYKSIDGNLYTKDGKTFLQYSIEKTETEFTIPDGVTVIEYGAFQGSSLTRITIPDSVTTIGDYAFAACSFTSITIPDSVTTIGSYAFRTCRALKNVTIGDSVTSLGVGAFFECSITCIIIPNSVAAIGYEAFAFSGSSANITSAYYKGTASEWAEITFGAYSDMIDIPLRAIDVLYYYSESAPTDEGNYWRYVDGVPTPW